MKAKEQLEFLVETGTVYISLTSNEIILSQWTYRSTERKGKTEQLLPSICGPIQISINVSENSTNKRIRNRIETIEKRVQ